MRKSYFNALLFLLLFFLIFDVGCSRRIEQPEEKILVDIENGRRTISLNEFIRRAEYTPRPVYCRRNTYIDKKIILNSLIAEKLLALEAEADNPLDKSESFRLFIQGHKEQAMRQWMHHVEATDKVELDTSAIKKAYRYAGREVEISHVLLSDSSLVDLALRRWQEGGAFQDIVYRATGDTTPSRRKVKWEDRELPQVHKALFSGDLQIGQVLPPIPVEDGKVLLLKVDGWSDTMAMTEKQRQERLNKVTERLTEMQASAIWQERVAEIMRGKRLDFNPDTFEKLNRMFFDIYFRTDEEQQDRFIEKIWGVERDETKESFYTNEDENFLSQSFFTVDGRVWTVNDFRRELLLHPLVFRQRKMPSGEFPAQFRLAVADLVRDHYVTKEAYRKGYDKVNVVQRNADMWRDRFLALYQVNKYLAEIGENRSFQKHMIEIIEKKLNPYINQLQQKYYKKVALDFDAFEDIQLTTIDLFVKQPEMPYKYVVPMFPVVTNDHMLEYVRKAP